MIGKRFSRRIYKLGRSKNFSKDLVIFPFLAIVILIYYHKAFGAYFEGDEWFYFSQFLPLTQGFLGGFKAVIISFSGSSQISGFGHVTPVYNLFWYILNKLFSLHYILYITTSLLLHTVNSSLVYFFAKLMIGNRLYAFIASVIFATSSIHYQAISWIMGFVPTQLSVFFILLALIYYYKFVVNKKLITRHLIIAIIFAALALFSKESSVILFIILPIILMFNKKRFRAGFFGVLTLLFIYIPLRFLLPLWLDSGLTQTQLPHLEKILLQSVLFPLRMLSQSIVPSEVIQGLSHLITLHLYPSLLEPLSTTNPIYSKLSQSISSDLASIAFSMVIMVIGIVFYFKSKSIKARVVILGFSIILFSSIPLIFVQLYAPWWGETSYIDSRHFYIASVGSTLVIVMFLSGIITYLSQFKKIKIVGYISLFILALFFLSFNYSSLQVRLSENLKTGQERKFIISKILEDVPKIDRNTVFIIESTANYYGFASLPPFQTNLGDVLKVHYYVRDQISEDLLRLSFGPLPIDSGFVKDKVKGVGYYVDEKLLLGDIYKNLYSINEIHAYQWDGVNFEDQTDKKRNGYNLWKEIRTSSHNWISQEGYKFTFRYPEKNMSMSKNENGRIIKLSSTNHSITMATISKPAEIPFHEYVPQLFDVNGAKISDNFKVRNITRVDGSQLTFVYLTKARDPMHLLPLYDSNYYLRIDYVGKTNEEFGGYDLYQSNLTMESILSTIFFE